MRALSPATSHQTNEADADKIMDIHVHIHARERREGEGEKPMLQTAQLVLRPRTARIQASLQDLNIPAM
jgi:diadenosine tetraphosphate (Ap4A) HIT family hydrolase